jgi:phosphoadenosine phosphosulfate reductase
MAAREFPGHFAVVSSFGTESAVLLALVAAVPPRLPVIFLETGKHFEETRRYRDDLVAMPGLEDVRLILPEADRVAQLDPDGQLCRVDPDPCCHMRKVAPLWRALEGFDAWITGRKRYQGSRRGSLPNIEALDGEVKINPGHLV